MIFNKGWFANFMVIFGYLMAFVYIGLGVMLFFPRVYPSVPEVLKITFAFFFIAYGFFRLVKQITRKRETDD